MIIRKNQKENDESTLDKIIPPKFISITNKSKDEKLLIEHPFRRSIENIK